MKPTVLLARVVLLSCAFAGSVAMAAPLDIQLPPDTSKLRPSSLPGFAIAMEKCAICHSADYVNYQPPGMNQTQWTAEMAKMQHVYGAPLRDDEVKQIGAYLAVAYGSAKESDASVVALSTAAAPPGAPSAAPAVDSNINVQALLASNACLSCHGLNQKIVGPAYHEVAERYKGDPQAQSKLETSIRGGGVGKWGNVPMPSFAALQPREVEALAAFVLKQ